VLYNFCSQRSCGTFPGSTLVLGTDGALYGTTTQGGTADCEQIGCGTIFRFAAGELTTLHTFQQTDGWVPNALTQTTRGYFVGTVYQGAESNSGTVFAISTGLKPFVTFVQSFAKVGQTGGVLGQGFTGATAVAFNGTPATFTVLSDTFLKTTIPQGATSGYVTVTTPTGVLTSNVPFRVIQ
jgi:uncharacterized repeat protein (TIGR03803 family)